MIVAAAATAAVAAGLASPAQAYVEPDAPQQILGTWPNLVTCRVSPQIPAKYASALNGFTEFKCSSVPDEVTWSTQMQYLKNGVWVSWGIAHVSTRRVKYELIAQIRTCAPYGMAPWRAWRTKGRATVRFNFTEKTLVTHSDYRYFYC